MSNEKQTSEQPQGHAPLAGVSHRFYSGQKVWCYYHYTSFFKPPMCGRVLLKIPFRMKHHFSTLYSDGKDGKCAWYLVQMKNGLIVSMPGVCMKDLKEEIEKHNIDNKAPLDIKQIDAWETLQRWQADRIRFLNGG